MGSEAAVYKGGLYTVAQLPPKIQVHVPDVLVGQNIETPVLGDGEKFIRFGLGEDMAGNPSNPSLKKQN